MPLSINCLYLINPLKALNYLITALEVSSLPRGLLVKHTKAKEKITEEKYQDCPWFRFITQHLVLTSTCPYEVEQKHTTFFPPLFWNIWNNPCSSKFSQAADKHLNNVSWANWKAGRSNMCRDLKNWNKEQLCRKMNLIKVTHAGSQP